MHRHFRNYLAFAALFSMAFQSLSISAQGLLSFSRDSVSAQQEIEKKFDSFLKRENLRDWMKRLSARPHHVGSPYGKENAEFMASLYRSWGYETKIEQFDVLFPGPKTRILEMTSPQKFTAKLEEPELKEDAASGQKSEQIPSYNAYSIDGDVTGDLVYVNYGVPADYDELEKHGISVKGKIVIARYGGSWRGIKPKVAAENGAIGCLIYSDPKNDGYYQGDVYPKGAWRREDGVQRGSVADMPLFPGDPLTPGIASIKGAKRLAIKDAPTLTKIPVMPISYADAEPLLRNLSGPVVPENWRGALPLTYHFGGQDSIKVRFKLEFNWDTKPIYNVIARMPGSEAPDQWVIRGNHHDAWVNGAADPISGQVAMLEEARGIGELVKAGWKPKRTIIYCSWDGEEPGLLGSTEWVEMHADELSKKAVAYINSDSNGRGFLGAGGSHSLESLVNQVSRDVVDPQTKVSILKRRKARDAVNSPRPLPSRDYLKIEALGSGSDFTPFLQHLGISSLNVGFGGEDGGGSYHSAYDSFEHYMRFSDSSFDYGIALAQTCGRMTMRLANAETLPFSFPEMSTTISEYLKEIITLTDSMREETKIFNSHLLDGSFALAQDPKDNNRLPAKKKPVPFMDFSPLQNAISGLDQSIANYEMAAKNANLSPAKRIQLNEIIFRAERALTNSRGLPRRDWFKHQIYAPGFYTGYGVKTIPAVREAIEQRDWIEAANEVKNVAETIQKFAAEIDRAAALAKSGG